MTTQKDQMAELASSQKNRLLLRLAAAYQYRETPFRLSSGETSHEYLDCRSALSDPVTLRYAATAILDTIDDDELYAVGGLTMGADPLAIATSLYGMAIDLRWFSVRKEPKSHGTGRLIEGAFKPGSKVMVVEDVSTTGASALKAVRACAEAGLDVIQVVSLVDRGGASRIKFALIAGEDYAPLAIQANVKSILPFEDVALVGRARQIALEAHGDQKYGDRPYSAHLENVVSILAETYSYNPYLLAAGWLHDVPEDTPVKVNDLAAKGMPGVVVSMVDACTDGDGRNRKEKKQRPYSLIPRVTDAVLVKLADRVANAEAVTQEGKPRLLDMYRKEQHEFRERLKNSTTSPELDAAPLWNRLESALT